MNVFFRPIPLKSWCQPLPLFVATVLFVLVVFWFGLALIEIHPGQAGITLRTGGWFYFGIPITLSIGLASGLVTTLVARKIGHLPVWIVIVPLSLFLAYDGGTRDSPERRLPVILGIDAESTQVLEYRVFDSFNDGNTTVGVLHPVSVDVFESIIKGRKLSSEHATSRPPLYEDNFPRGLPTALNDRLALWYDASEKRLYFRYYSRAIRGGRIEEK